MSNAQRVLFFFLLLIGLSACASHPAPFGEYTLARAALTSAKDSGAERLASGLWYEAEEGYRSGQKAYAESDFAKAKIYFLKVIQLAEKAENASRLKRFETGETLQ